jgi:small subunit ribosomal protein S6e
MPLLVVSDPSTGKSQKIELEDSKITPLIGKRIGETIDGSLIGIQGYELKITGGTDKDGIPMRPDVHGGSKMAVILSGGVGYNPKNKGLRKKKVVRGNTISIESKFLNLSIVGQTKGVKRTSRRKTKIESKEENPPESEKKEEQV